MRVSITVYAAIALILLPIVSMACGAGSPEQEGEQLFADNCARCHGAAADGTLLGPPLVHRIYEPGHHADFTFYNAVKNGVVSHHWDFGDMPPVAGLSEDDVTQIIAYVRGLQREGGIIR
ncbi:MAG: cytochrome c [Chloroflexi bacterium]|nr:cytochrome c [Chloroflexota bacterium]